MTKELTPLIELLLTRTVWVIRGAVSGFEAIDHEGNVIATGKFKSTLIYTLSKEAAEKGSKIYAIASVINPGDRFPNRKLNNRRVK